MHFLYVQIKLAKVIWMEVARSLRRTFPLSFPGRGHELKDVKSVSKICKNALKKYEYFPLFLV